MLKTRRCLILVFGLAAGLAGCGGSGSSNDSASTCTGDDQRQAIYDLMNNWYFWYKDMPSVSPGDYSSNQALLDVLATPEHNLGKHYSYLTTETAEQALLNNAAYIGFGFSSTLTPDTHLYLRDVFPGSPADLAGLLRGDEILAIEGETITALIATDTFDTAFGDATVGVTRSFDVRHADGSEETIAVSKADVTVPTVSYAQTFDLDGDGTKETGYLFFRSFLLTSPGELDAVFSQPSWNNVTRLVLDERYNGGGVVDVARYLGSLIAGEQHPGGIFGKMEFNDKHTANNTQLVLDTETYSHPITDLVVITTGSTASASELVINGLKPFINVWTVGDTSYGKPVGQVGLGFCGGNILRAIGFQVVNSNDEGGYFNGIAPDCAADDDLAHTLGNESEASLAEAINVLKTSGSCSTASPKALYRLSEKRAAFNGDPNPLYRDGRDFITGGAR